MSDIDREEFDALVGRVEKLESLNERTWSMIGHLDTSLREVHAKLIDHDGRFDSIDRSLESIIERLS